MSRTTCERWLQDLELDSLRAYVCRSRTQGQIEYSIKDSWKSEDEVKYNNYQANNTQLHSTFVKLLKKNPMQEILYSTHFYLPSSMCSLNYFLIFILWAVVCLAFAVDPSHWVSRDWNSYSRNFKVRMFQNMVVKNNGIQNVFRVKKQRAKCFANRPHTGLGRNRSISPIIKANKNETK